LNQYDFTDTATVSYIDISPAGLDYQRYLVESWDGDLDNYEQTSTQFQLQHPEYRYAWRSWNSWDSEVETFLSEANISRTEFKALWQRYLKLHHDYVQLDLLTEGDKLVELASKASSQTYLWLSNAFQMQWTIFRYGRTATEEKLNAIKSALHGNYVVESSGLLWYSKS
jgi:hypothetical protein